MEKKHSISELMDTTMEKLRNMVESNTIVGTPIRTVDGITLIPVSQLSLGFGAGGTEYPSKHSDRDLPFGGGGGAGVNISPVAFLVVNGDSVKLLPMAPTSGSTIDRVVDMVPELVAKVTDYIDKKTAEKAEVVEE